MKSLQTIYDRLPHFLRSEPTARISHDFALRMFGQLRLSGSMRHTMRKFVIFSFSRADFCPHCLQAVGASTNARECGT
eukprot:385312-Hanusia_phi.AAC.1